MCLTCLRFDWVKNCLNRVQNMPQKVYTVLKNDYLSWLPQVALGCPRLPLVDFSPVANNLAFSSDLK